MTASGGVTWHSIQHPTKFYWESTTRTHTFLRPRRLVPGPVPVFGDWLSSSNCVAFSPRLPPTPSRAHYAWHMQPLQPLQPPASHRLRSFKSTAMTRLPSFSRACAVLSTSGRRRRAITMESRSGIIAKWLGGSQAHDSAYLLRDEQRSVGSDVNCALCRIKSL